jgi:hypothetical protein
MILTSLISLRALVNWDIFAETALSYLINPAVASTAS